MEWVLQIDKNSQSQKQVFLEMRWNILNLITVLRSDDLSPGDGKKLFSLYFCVRAQKANFVDHRYFDTN